ncbi:putative pectinesterase 29 [Tasmannia lanceolata]|uniref:putative pectinesterase 29 n=1 Tax=Tasmannia lanceolata TaxID=3420 RepID=UPI004062DEBB
MSSCVILLLSALFYSGGCGCVQGKPVVANTIIVDARGGGNFKSIQAAVNSVPPNNSQWIRIKVNRGVYLEKVTISKDRPFILLEGHATRDTIIAWGDSISTEESPTFHVDADNFVAKCITFKNTFNHKVVVPRPPNSDTRQAVAAMIYGDKSSFYYCSFVGFQDTLADMQGRHYFNHCYIEGAIDFIFGYGQSIYQSCALYVTVNSSSPFVGSITAQGRAQATDTNGFVFNNCRIHGTGKTYLGRAWGNFSRVIFYKTTMSRIVIPAGWNPMVAVGHVDTITFAENGCTGKGSNLSGRVKWEKKLTATELSQLTSLSFIDPDGWIEQQP